MQPQDGWVVHMHDPLQVKLVHHMHNPLLAARQQPLLAPAQSPLTFDSAFFG